MEATKTMIHFLVSICVDYCNSIFYGAMIASCPAKIAIRSQRGGQTDHEHKEIRSHHAWLPNRQHISSSKLQPSFETHSMAIRGPTYLRRSDIPISENRGESPPLFCGAGTPPVFHPDGLGGGGKFPPPQNFKFPKTQQTMLCSGVNGAINRPLPLNLKFPPKSRGLDETLDTSNQDTSLGAKKLPCLRIGCVELPVPRHYKSRTGMGTFQNWIENSSISFVRHMPSSARSAYVTWLRGT